MGDKRFVDICMKGTLEEVREALANGADVNERCEEFKGTSLINAVFDDNEPLVSLLLQQPGIQVNAKDGYKNGWTALHYAAFNRGDKGRKVIRLLLNYTGIDMEIRDILGETPLMKATKITNKDFLEEYEKKMEDDKKIRANYIVKESDGDTSDVIQENRKRKRETFDASPQEANMWKKLKTVQNRQKAAVKKALKKKEDNKEELVKMEEKMVEELDKEW